MKDNEIIRALKCCNGWDGRCLNCPLKSEGTNCKEKLNSYSLDLITRQKAEIEKLKQNNDILSRNADNAFQAGLNENRELYKNEVEAEIKSEAIKEFAERLKNRSTAQGKKYIAMKSIDKVVKKMMEEEENA